nr:immunoglobulin light chain junction region [Macaca mulatta]MOW09670.1 immunoglobulin light chain junction region [Macaca mulatta]MOW09906.1 immunoglobulin light chain junction region [Macaca mulatta]MOW10989.1 immunoglobulin light chain junction region [Macaca mulatta]MOW11545.1 immunoglobulin light chain junction region [Macaca mulatta]
CQMYINTPFTF